MGGPEVRAHAAVDSTGGYHVAPVIAFLRSIGCRLSTYCRAGSSSMTSTILPG